MFTPRLDETVGARAVAALLQRLMGRPGLRCRAVAWRDGVHRARLEEAGIPVHIASGWPAPDPESYESRLVELAALVGDELDVALVEGLGAFPGADVAARLEVPFIWAQGEPALPTEGRGMPPGRCEEVIARAGAVLCGSDASRDRFDLAPPARRATVRSSVEHGKIAAFCDRIDSAEARRRLGVPQDATVALCLAPIVPDAGQLRLAEATAGLAERHPDLLLALVGDGSSSYAAELRSYAHCAGLTARLIEASESDPYLWHRAADVFATGASGPSLGAIEAMAFGTPVVAMRGSDVSEAIIDGRTGYLCDEDDLGELTASLERALGATREEREKVGARAGKSVRAKHGAKAGAERVGRLVDALAEDPRALAAQAIVEGGDPRPGPTFAVAEKVSVLIPTLDAGPTFARSLEALLAQEGLGGLELLVVDSGSTDDTVPVATSAGARVIEIPRAAFNHGRVRNQMAEAAGGDVLLSTVQDAMLLDRHALRELVLRLRADPTLAAVTPRQVPGPGADLHSAYWAWRRDHAPGHGAVAGEGESAPVDNVCAAVRRTAWEALRFRELPYGEDLDFGVRALREEWRTARADEVVVQHHHDREAPYFLRRAAAERLMRVGLTPGVQPIPEARHGIEALAGALATGIAELERALGSTSTGGESVALAPFVRGVIRELQGDAVPAAPTGELESIRELLRGAPSEVPREAAVDIRAWMVHALFDPWVAHFALAVAEPVPTHEARAFVARLVAGSVGQVLGDAMRAAPEAPLALRLRGDV